MSESSRHALILCLLLGLPILAIGGPRLPRSGNARSIGDPAASTSWSAPVRQAPPPAELLTKGQQDLSQQAWFDAVRTQLKSLGAVYIRLERWEGVCPVYQFRCDLERESEGTNQTSIEAFSGSAQIASEYVLLAARQWCHRVSDGSRRGPPAPSVSGRQRLARH